MVKVRVIQPTPDPIATGSVTAPIAPTHAGSCLERRSRTLSRSPSVPSPCTYGCAEERQCACLAEQISPVSEILSVCVAHLFVVVQRSYNPRRQFQCLRTTESRVTHTSNLLRLSRHPRNGCRCRSLCISCVRPLDRRTSSQIRWSDWSVSG
jgi:hypothetical protein